MNECWNCGRSGDDFRRCGSCKTAIYCNEVCQRAQWRNHKIWCKTFESARASGEKVKNYVLREGDFPKPFFRGCPTEFLNAGVKFLVKAAIEGGYMTAEIGEVITSMTWTNVELDAMKTVFGLLAGDIVDIGSEEGGSNEAYFRKIVCMIMMNRFVPPEAEEFQLYVPVDIFRQWVIEWTSTFTNP
jgi:hypothetical protein